jgi:hypothetical protein
MPRREETTGRYCLPVNPEPPLTSHPAYRYAVAMYVVGLAAMVASGTHLLSANAGQRTALEAVFIVCFMGYIGIISWIRHHGGTRRLPDQGRETAG